MNKAKSLNTRKLALLALLTAIVVVLQALAAVLPIYPFTLTLVLVPMVIGAALVGTLAGGWLGLVFGLVVLLTGNANVFLAIDPLATILIVMIKGILAGLAAGIVYRSTAKISKTAAAISAAVISPIVNTGIFAAGVYFIMIPSMRTAAMNMDPAFDWLRGLDLTSPAALIFIGFIGLNFFLELGINLVLSPTIVRLIQYGQDKRATE